MIGASCFRGRRLCVVGNLNRDLRIAPISPGNHLFEDGETSTEHVREMPGGGGANSAVFAATLGARVRLVAKVGDDAAGRALRRTIRRLRVRPYLAIDPSHRTGTSINLVFDNGRRHFISALQACAISYDEIDPAAMGGAEHLLRADVWFSEQMLFGGNEKLFEAAKSVGADTSLDLNWDPQWGRALRGRVVARKRAVRRVLPLVDLAHGNVRELCEFTDADTLGAALKRLTRWGAGAVVVHLGSRGGGYYAGGKLVRSPSVRAAKTINTTGTGDLLSVCMMLLQRHAAPVRAKLDTANQVVSRYIEGNWPGAFLTAGTE